MFSTSVAGIRSKEMASEGIWRGEVGYGKAILLHPV